MKHRRRRTDRPAPQRDHTDGAWLGPLMFGAVLIVLIIINLALR